MANINKITVDGVEYKITIPSGLTAEEQAQVRQNIGAISAADAEVVRDGTYPDMTVGNATHAQNADTLATPRAIDGVSFNGSAAITHYGVCSTAAGTTAKTVALTGFTLVTGARITVKFTTANTVSSPTLNVNGTGAKAMKCKNRTTYLAWQAEIMTLVYDGTNWCIIDGYSLTERPVGTHHIQYDGEETPAARFGGTWAADNDYAGRVLVGSGTGFTLGATGGNATVSLNSENNGPHTHDVQIYTNNNIGGASGTSPAYGYVAVDASKPASSWTIYTGDNAGGKTVSSGSGTPFSIMPPYKVVAVWKRTA